ncbi:MAG: class I SAM-dependent methyltransferase [Bacteriovoracaceae bacterium]|nr:class I SAM-dependent methyltransferase [Bacteriovoracaceae bacterium]
MLIENEFSLDHCPFCQSKSLKDKGKLEYPTDLLFSSVEIDLKYEPRLIRCLNCKSGFTNNAINESTAVSLYTLSDSSARWNQGANFLDSKPEIISAFLKKHIARGSNVLDIGANTGELLDFCKDHIGTNTFAYELSERSQEKLIKKGHKVINCLQSIEKNTMDTICLFDVVEHLYNQNEFLLNLYDLLSEDGKIIILTGNINSLSSKLALNNWWYLKAPEHVRFPSLKVFKGLKGYSYLGHIKTVNSNGYKSTLTQKIKLIIKFLIRYKNLKYTGIPLLSTDHYVVALKKQVLLKEGND